MQKQNHGDTRGVLQPLLSLSILVKVSEGIWMGFVHQTERQLWSYILGEVPVWTYTCSQACLTSLTDLVPAAFCGLRLGPALPSLSSKAHTLYLRVLCCCPHHHTWGRCCRWWCWGLWWCRGLPWGRASPAPRVQGGLGGQSSFVLQRGRRQPESKQHHSKAQLDTHLWWSS